MITLGRSTLSSICGTSARNVVKAPASSGSLPASAISWLAVFESAVMSVPVRLCNSNWKPPVAPRPGMGGGLKLVIWAVGMAEN